MKNKFEPGDKAYVVFGEIKLKPCVCKECSNIHHVKEENLSVKEISIVSYTVDFDNNYYHYFIDRKEFATIEKYVYRTKQEAEKALREDDTYREKET